MTEKNLTLPGNPRYQPKSLQPIWGYDNLYRAVGKVELAVMHELAERGIIDGDDFALLTVDIKSRIIDIRTTDVDERERKVTKHDIRAWVQLAKEILPEPLHRWLHVPLTSYDVLDTARALQFREAHLAVIEPALDRVLRILAELIEQHAEQRQIGRTHGQHALPITFGFFMATIANRLLVGRQEMKAAAENIRGKISGAVGAYNAQQGLGFSAANAKGQGFEISVLDRLKLYPGEISTQIVQPESLATYLFAVLKTSAALAQLGRDCRHLMRSEIAEVREEFEPGQVGSSTMAHKRNPVNFENLEGMYIRSKNEFGKVLDTMISEHQRDLVGSSVARDYPIIVVNLVNQLETLLRESKDGTPFLRRISVDADACHRNFRANAHLTMAEPLYIALQRSGYAGDAHELANNKLVREATRTGKQLITIAEELSESDSDLAAALSQMNPEIRQLLGQPEQYIGEAANRARDIAAEITRTI